MTKAFAVTLSYLLVLAILIITPLSGSGLLLDADICLEPSYFSTEEGLRLKNAFELHVDEIQDGKDLEISNIKPASDFIGNEYYVVELDQYGYFIYNVESGLYVESSASAISPYSEYDSNIYYYGPTYYYYMSADGNLHHTIIENEEITSQEFTEIAQSEEVSQLQENLLDIKSERVLNYVKNNVEMPQPAETMSVVNSNGFTSVKGYWFLQNQTVSYSTYENDGSCGYTAMAYLIGYYDYMSGKRLVPSNMMDRVITCNHPYPTVLVSFIMKLINLGGSMGFDNYLDASEIKAILKKYFEDINVSVTLYTDTNKLTTTNNKIAGHIDNDRPCILGGSIPIYSYDGTYIGLKNHAVVAYGYKRDADGNFITRVNYGLGKSFTDVQLVNVNWFLTNAISLN